MSHLPAAGRPVPASTYRVQLHPSSGDDPGFGFAAAAQVVPYLAELGVTHLYCSPYLQAAPGSAHGYDVVDHSRLNEELGGAAAFERLVTACRQHGLGLVLDVVPNHMSVGAPESGNSAWCSLLRDGRSSPYADWFDVDWDSPASPGQVLVPVLAAPLEEAGGDLRLDGEVIRYFDHELPVAPGTLVPGDVLATLARQHYRLAHWRLAGTQLNYRRFFDVTSLAGVRVEQPEVFAATHELVLRQVREGILDGLRIDHPDGLADPQGYLARLAEATGGSWVVVEKILEPGEDLPAEWACAGTTGYDALNAILGLFVDPAGEGPLTQLWQSVTGDPAPYAEVALQAKHEVLTGLLGAEVTRLAGLAARAVGAPGPDALREALVALLAAFPVYRAYLPATGPAGPVARAQVGIAVRDARSRRPDLAAALDLLARLALAEAGDGPVAREFVVRFQQTCGPVMAKGVEDTAFYRYLRLSALNEVGGDPGRFGLSLAAFHTAMTERQAAWPLSMTALSTHDTKRSEDVRARLALLSQCAPEWVEAVSAWSRQAETYRSAAGPDPATEQLVWQTLVGAWPIDADRLTAYLTKAGREAKRHTSWLDPDPAVETAVERFARGVLADPALRGGVADFTARLAPAWRATLLAHKLLALTLPGVADTYQGSEMVDLSLVDPDNRRPVDYRGRQAALAGLTPGSPPSDPDAAKLHLVTTALRLRRAQPQWFLAGSSYEPLDAGSRAVGFLRSGQVAVVAPVRAVQTERHGWGEDVALLPPGDWVEVLTDRTVPGGQVALRDLLAGFPVALLVRR